MKNGAMILDGCNNAIVGCNIDGTLIYDYELLVEVFCDEHEMSLMEAREWIDFNIIGLIGNAGSPSIRMPESL
jgi:hypothetical protein